MLKAIFFDMDETLCGTSQADKVAGQEFADWIAQTYPQVTDSTAFVQRYLQGVYKKLNDEFPQLIALLPDENAFRCGLIQSILQNKVSRSIQNKRSRHKASSTQLEWVLLPSSQA